MYPFSFLGSGIDAQAQAHYNRVIADGGLIPSGLDGVNTFFTTVKTIYGTADITTAISVGLDAQVLGYKLGAGSGTTLGQAAQKLYSCSGASGDVEQTTAASQPLLLVHEGANYWWSGGNLAGVINAPNITIPTSSGMSIEAKVLFTTNDDSINTGGWICSNDDGGGTRSMFFGFKDSRTLVLYWANLSREATATAQIPSAFNGWVKATLETSGAADMLAKFFTSLDGITYTQLGSTITNSGGANTFQTNPATFWVTGNGGSNNILGKIFRVIYKDANGITKADFNPNQYNAATSQTQWTSSTEEVWTINTGTATTGYKGVLVDRTITMGDGVDDSLEGLSPLVSQPDTIYFSNRIVSSGGGWIIDGLGVNRQIINKGAANINLFAGTFDFAAISVSLRNLLTCVFNGASSQIQINNGTATTGLNTGTLGLQNLTIHGTAGAFAEGTILTTIVSNSLNNSTQRTAMYDYIKSINNNAF